MTRRRIVMGAVALVLLAGAFTAWKVWQVQRDLAQAESTAQELRASFASADSITRNNLLAELQSSASSARRHSDGPWLGLLAHLPLVGDDIRGVRALSASLDSVASDGVQPLADAVDSMSQLSTGGAVDLDALAALQQPLSRSAAAVHRARTGVSTLDSSGYAGFLKSRFSTYVNNVTTLDRGAASAERVVSLLPTILGADGPRDYFLVFQNNAEIRSTGGLPGSWAVVHAEAGKLSITQQGAGANFAELDQPVVPLTAAEREVYEAIPARSFLFSNYIADYPRVAQLWKAFYEQKYAPATIDGVISLDPVALSYLLRGTGPVQVGTTTLTADTAVQQLLNQPYLTLDPPAQDAFFAASATAIFDAVTGDLQSPLELVQGAYQAADEGRFLMSFDDDAVQSELAGSRVAGSIDADDGNEPHAQVAVTDITGSKMSYYLRFRARVTSQSCTGGTQSLLGTMTLNQTINAAEGAALPDSVTGAGDNGTPPGSQTLELWLFGPVGGTLDTVRIDGKMIDADPIELDGRPVTYLYTRLSGPDDVVVTWTMQSGEGQTGDGTVGVTPSIVPGLRSSTFASSC